MSWFNGFAVEEDFRVLVIFPSPIISLDAIERIGGEKLAIAICIKVFNDISTNEYPHGSYEN